MKNSISDTFFTAVFAAACCYPLAYHAGEVHQKAVEEKARMEETQKQQSFEGLMKTMFGDSFASCPKTP